MSKETIEIKKGDVLRVVTSGGGGWGDPLERDPEMVKADVRNSGVSIARAKDVYGVVIEEDSMDVDMEATEELRQSMKENGCRRS